MFNYIKGQKEFVSSGKLVIDVGGIGYELNISSYCEQFVADKDVVKVYTYLAVREDDVSLFGFYSLPEKEMFLQLTSVSGIGPKVALAVLSNISVDKLAANIIAQDTAALNKIKGIGKKTAARIVLELKDKIAKDYAEADVADVQLAKPEEQPLPACDDAVMALMTLGYTRKESTELVSKVASDGMTVEEIIFNALKNA